MFNTNCKVYSDEFKVNLTKGFAGLLQKQEFVDLTLAADGHLLAAHKNVLALASPYIREILKSVPCQHPVIFLSNINYTVLSLILEYVYTGEVEVPSHTMLSFIEAAKILHISGIDHLVAPDTLNKPNGNSTAKPVDISVEKIIENATISSNIEVASSVSSPTFEPLTQIEDDGENTKATEENNMVDFEEIISQQNNPLLIPTLPTANGDINVNCEYINDTNMNIDNDTHQESYSEDGQRISDDSFVIQVNDKQNILVGLPELEEPFNNVNFNTIFEKHAINSNVCTNTPGIHKNENMACETSIEVEPTSLEDPVQLDAANILNSNSLDCNKKRVIKKTIEIQVLEHTSALLYSISDRGSPLMILDSFVYNMHHQSRGGRKRRWRCADYRAKHCTAYVDTDDDNIVTR